MHIHRGDVVQVVAGKEKDRRGKVLRVLTSKSRVVVEKVMMIKRHTRPTQKNPQGGIVDKEGSIHWSNVALYCESCKGPRRAKIKQNEGGAKIRVCKKCDSEFLQPGM